VTEERRYLEDEVAEIFEAAATPRATARPGPSPAQGLTLAELQAIGREVGVAPDRIADAASELDRRRSDRRRTDLDMPISLFRSVDLPRAPTDREWAILLTELRETFSARGNDRSSGEIREWSIGNLDASIVPAEDGYRFRLRTADGSAVAVNRLGMFAWLMGLVFMVISLNAGNFGDGLLALLVFGAMGTAALAYNAFRLQRWAEEREKQMDYLASRARALIGSGLDGAGEV
jgi:hypothetical protein